MPTKIAVISENPKDPAAFETRYHEQYALAKQIPGVHRVESAKVWPKEDGTATPAYRLLDIYFTGYDAASEAVKDGADRSVCLQGPGGGDWRCANRLRRHRGVLKGARLGARAWRSRPPACGQFRAGRGWGSLGSGGRGPI